MTLQTITWDEYDLAQSKARELLDAGICETDEEAFEAAICDAEFLALEFEDFQDYFSEILNDISPDGVFFVEGRNMGWRHRSGTLGLEAHDASRFIERAFPQTSEWTLRGEYDPKRKVLSYRLSHHDAPTGEFYTVRQGFRHPADGEILPEKPVIEINVYFVGLRARWMAEDSTGEWHCADTKRQAIAEARRMRRLWREGGYKTALTIGNRHS